MTERRKAGAISNTCFYIKMVKHKSTIKPIIPNKGIELWYRKQLMKLIDDMQHSAEYWLKAEYKKQLPEIAQDALPANFNRRES